VPELSAAAVTFIDMPFTKMTHRLVPALSVFELRAVLSDCPDGAKVSIDTSNPDIPVLVVEGAE
jgi:hypothetical protein